MRCPSCGLLYPAGTERCTADGAALQATAGDDDPLASGPTRRRASAPDAPPSGAGDGLVHLTGKTLGDYVVGDFLGAGAMCEVYAGRHAVIGKPVAIKVLKLELARDAELAHRMLTEARAVSSVHHRGIVDIYHFDSLPDGRPYLVMEHLTGESLDLLLERRGHLDPAEACGLLEQLAGALAAAHAAGVIHRDLKPANAFQVTGQVGDDAHVKLLDFGLAKSLQPSGGAPRTMVGAVLGTPNYISPEQANAQSVSAQTDLYSLGVMAFELLTGRLPFNHDSALAQLNAHRATPAPRPSSVAGGIPAELDALVLQLLAKAPAERPASAEVVRREFKRLRLALEEGSAHGRRTRPGLSPEPAPLPVTERQAPVVPHPAGDVPNPAPARVHVPWWLWVLGAAAVSTLALLLAVRATSHQADALLPQPSLVPVESLPVKPAPRVAPTVEPTPASPPAAAVAANPGPKAAGKELPTAAPRGPKPVARLPVAPLPAPKPPPAPTQGTKAQQAETLLYAALASEQEARATLRKAGGTELETTATSIRLNAWFVALNRGISTARSADELVHYRDELALCRYNCNLAGKGTLAKCQIWAGQLPALEPGR